VLRSGTLRQLYLYASTPQGLGAFSFPPALGKHLPATLTPIPRSAGTYFRSAGCCNTGRRSDPGSVTGTFRVCYGQTGVEMRSYTPDECDAMLRESVSRGMQTRWPSAFTARWRCTSGRLSRRGRTTSAMLRRAIRHWCGRSMQVSRRRCGAASSCGGTKRAGGLCAV